MSESENESQGKGFKGLQSLSSRSPGGAVEPSPLRAREERTPESPSAPPKATAQPAQPLRPESKTAAPAWRGWVIGLGILGSIVGFLVWIGSQPSPTRSYQVRSTSSYEAPPLAEVAPTELASGPTITIPPVGNGLVLSSDKIRYCVYEDRRIKGAEKAVDNYVQVSVDAFNAMVDDYNSRCGYFRYKSGALEPIQREADQIQMQLEREGRERMTPILEGVAAADAAMQSADAAAAAAEAASYAAASEFVDQTGALGDEAAQDTEGRPFGEEDLSEPGSDY